MDATVEVPSCDKCPYFRVSNDMGAEVLYCGAAGTAMVGAVHVKRGIIPDKCPLKNGCITIKLKADGK